MRALARGVLFGAALLAFVAIPLHGQDDAPPVVSSGDAEEAKAPVRTARLAFLAGDLKVQRADNTGEDSAVSNMPLPEGTRLVTGDDGEAEVEFEDGSVARLTPHSALAIDAMTLEKAVAHTQMTLLSGLAYFELRQTEHATWSIEAGQVLATPTANVALRVSLGEPPATFAVLGGSVFVSLLADPSQSEGNQDAGFTAEVHTGESLRADPVDRSRYFLNQQVAEESWDKWNQSRDELAESDAASRTPARDAYASTQAYGWSDLDSNGTWYAAPASQTDGEADGGGDEVWQPAVAADADSGFDPYGDGAFVWSGQGYLWASGYSWGWLPYRCGRWDYYAGLGWVWRPNRLCLTWGFGGGGDISIGHRPPHYRPVGKPIPGPGPIHPIHRLRMPGRPEPPQPVGRSNARIALIDGFTARPLKPVAGARDLVAPGIGGVLRRDFPVDTVSKKPILGTISDAPFESSQHPVSGWVPQRGHAEPVTARPVTGTLSPGSLPPNNLPNSLPRSNLPAPPPPLRTVTPGPAPQPRPVESGASRPAPPPPPAPVVQKSDGAKH